ncbi:BTAD domain-containing putative transcriptional regulator [Streptomyces sp. 6N223]|uniref:BTAD domain-containing putative transcriptional regulator n=1 Tax=Streptomyces sp. 6N223 TaxID=3457412 RepID=UPI003FD648CC
MGPLRARMGDVALDLGPCRQQAVFAVLLFHANQVITPTEILKAVWGEKLPGSGAKVIPPYMYRLRGLLSSGPYDLTGAIRTSREGYILRLGPRQLDVERFREEVDRATAAEESGNTEEASALLTTALGRWYGEPLAGLPGPFLESQRWHLTEQRLSVLERRIALDLQLERHDTVIPELAALLAAHPLRERLAAMLMTAFVRRNRQADALAVFARTRTALVEQLGMEPGPELRAVHESVLRAEPQAAARLPRPRARPGATPAKATPVAPELPSSHRPPVTAYCDLPHVTSTFVGRAHELAVLTGSVRGGTTPGARVDVIDGMPGSGKTTLAVQCARLLAPHYPDGQLFVDLLGDTADREPLSPGTALSVLMRAAGVGDAGHRSLDEQVRRWRAALADRRMLLVLDGAAGVRQVRALIPGGPLCRVIITSRRRLIGLTTTTVLSLDVLSLAEAVELFTTIVGRDRIRGEEERVPEVVELCGCLPNTVRIAADRLVHRPSWTLADMVSRLRDPAAGLRFFRADDRCVEGALLNAYNSLSAQQIRIVRVLCTNSPADRDLDQISRETGMSPLALQDDLEHLLNEHLLCQPRGHTFRLNELVRRHILALTMAGTLPAALRDHLAG